MTSVLSLRLMKILHISANVLRVTSIPILAKLKFLHFQFMES